MKRLLLRADDLGYSEAVNYGIEKSVKNGLIRSVGVMVNMSATDHGVKLLHHSDIAFGQHTNICVGRPLSDSALIPSLVNKDGYFKSSKEYRSAKEDFVVFEEALIEIEAQYHKFVSLFGRKPDYFEGHAIVSENFFLALEYFAEQKGLTYSGLPKNKDPNDLESNSFMYVEKNKVYVTMDAMKENYDPYRTFQNLIDGMHSDGIDMMVFHPGYLDQYVLNHSTLLIPRTQEVEMLSDPKIKEIINEMSITCIDYRDLS